MHNKQRVPDIVSSMSENKAPQWMHHQTFKQTESAQSGAASESGRHEKYLRVISPSTQA